MPSYRLVTHQLNTPLGHTPEVVATFDVPLAIDEQFRASAKDALIKLALRLSKGARLPGLNAVPVTVIASNNPGFPVGTSYPSSSAASRALGHAPNRLAAAFSILRTETVTIDGITLKKS